MLTNSLIHTTYTHTQFITVSSSLNAHTHALSLSLSLSPCLCRNFNCQTPNSLRLYKFLNKYGFHAYACASKKPIEFHIHSCAALFGEDCGTSLPLV